VAGELEGKVAVVTGGSRNIGRATALRLAGLGASVAVTYQVDAEGANETVRQVGELGIRAVAYQATLEDASVPESIIGLVERDLGPVDVLVNSAAIRPRQPLGEVSAEAFDSVFALNVRAGFLLAQAVAAGMRAREFGRIIFLGGISSYIGQSDRAAVMASKLAVVGLSRSLAFDLAPFGITVNVVVPGRIDTVRGAAEDYGPARDREGQAARTLVGHLGSPEDVAGCCAYLALPSTSFITGQELFVTGGAHPLIQGGVG
jgi:NAD(P)-dependent dehydrogenase (short-subunit alcohol dehydrogenase family)